MAEVLPLLRAAQLAELLGTTVVGDPDVAIRGARALLDAGPADVSFVADDKHQRDLEMTRAAALIARPGFRHHGTTILEARDPFLAFFQAFERFHPALPNHDAAIDPRAIIDPTATLGKGCFVGPFACVGAGSVVGKNCSLHAGAIVGRHCTLGDGCTLYPHAVIYDACTLGDRVILHAHAVIGADGFGYRLEGGKHIKIPQLAGVEIGNDVEIGAGTTIDRGTFAPTRVGAGTKIDNLVQVGHNCQLGRHNLLVSQVGIGGSSVTGDYVVIAGQVGVADHVHIGDQAILGARSGVPSDVPAKAKVLGAPARPERDAKMILLSMDKLPELRHDVRKIKQHLGLTG